MADDGVVWDDSDFQIKSSQKIESVISNAIKAANAIAHTVLLLSQKEVPIHTVPGKPGGDLARSGVVVDAKDPTNIDASVGYNKAYAAYQHEGMRKDGTHVVRNYTNPRSKPKYLEEPIKQNMELFRQYFRDLLK